MRPNLGLTATLAAVALCGLSLSANAAVVFCPGTPQVTDREFSLSTSGTATCIGSNIGNLNGNGDAVNALGYVTIDKSDNTTTYVGGDGELSISGTGGLS